MDCTGQRSLSGNWHPAYSSLTRLELWVRKVEHLYLICPKVPYILDLLLSFSILNLEQFLLHHLFCFFVINLLRIHISYRKQCACFSVFKKTWVVMVSSSEVCKMPSDVIIIVKMVERLQIFKYVCMKECYVLFPKSYVREKDFIPDCLSFTCPHLPPLHYLLLKHSLSILWLGESWRCNISSPSLDWLSCFFVV